GPRDNAACLANQRLAFPARPLGTLLRKRRHRDHLAMSALTAQPAKKTALEKLGVEPIGLRPTMFARYRDARCMNDVGLDPLGGEPARQPEAVVPGFERHGDACDPVAVLRAPRPPALQQAQQCVLV